MSDNISIIIIDMDCHRSYPCQHIVTIGHTHRRMSATDIIDLLRQKKMPIPRHFTNHCQILDAKNKILIGEMCFNGTGVCQHNVQCNDQYYFLNSSKIVELLLELKLPLPVHFINVKK